MSDSRRWEQGITEIRSYGIAGGRPVSGGNIPDHDPVNHPRHYTSHPSGIECIDIVEHMTFNTGNAVKYVWRAGLKDDPVEDLMKARWYLDREIRRLSAPPG